MMKFRRRVFPLVLLATLWLIMCVVPAASSFRLIPRLFVKRRLRPRRFVKRQVQRFKRWLSSIDIPGIKVIQVRETGAEQLLADHRRRQHKKKLQSVRIVELGKDKFPTPQNSKHHWLILFCKSKCPAGRGKLKEITRRGGVKGKGIYRVGYVNCRKSKKQNLFCASKGYGSMKENNEYAVVIHGNLQFFESSQSWNPQSLHENVMLRLAKDYLFIIHESTDIDTLLLNDVYKNNYEKPAVLLFKDKKKTPAWYHDLVYRLRDDFFFGVVEKRNQELENHFLERLKQGFKVHYYPELLVLLPFPSMVVQINNATFFITPTGNGEDYVVVKATIQGSKYNGALIVARAKSVSIWKDHVLAWLKDMKRDWNKVLRSEAWKSAHGDIGKSMWITLSGQDNATSNAENEGNYSELREYISIYR